MIVTFTGDISITGDFVAKVNANKEIFSNSILNHLNSSHYTVCNFEGAATDFLPISKAGKIKLKSPKSTISYLAKRNINVFNLANNHILDCTSKGVEDTIDLINRNNCTHFGIGKSPKESCKIQILEKDDLRIGVVGLTVSSVNIKSEIFEVASDKHLSIIKQNIRDLKDQADYIIMNYHGGEEFTNFPSIVKRNFLRKLSKINGVDIVICHHSHTLQGFEYFKEVPVFYSLGNFIFDIDAHKPYANTNTSALLKFNFTKDNFQFEFAPLKIDKGKILDYNSEDFNNKFKLICNFSSYKKKWRAEAYRVLFRKNLIQTETLKAVDSTKSLQNKSIFKLMISREFYLKSFKVIKSKNYRNLYLSAIIHKITNSL